MYMRAYRKDRILRFSINKCSGNSGQFNLNEANYQVHLGIIHNLSLTALTIK